jgi:tryptophan-rich sensory protein
MRRVSPRRRAILVAAGAALVVALAGGAATQVGPWYRGLDKSPLTPPDWVFGPAWTLIYATTVVAAVECWQRIHTFRERAWLLSLYFCNAVLNVLWSFFFFAWHRPDWALAEVIVLWLSVAALTAFSWPRSRRAGLLLTPYLVWVAFAGYLNLVVVTRNGPFDA